MIPRGKTQRLKKASSAPLRTTKASNVCPVACMPEKPLKSYLILLSLCQKTLSTSMINSCGLLTGRLTPEALTLFLTTPFLSKGGLNKILVVYSSYLDLHVAAANTDHKLNHAPVLTCKLP